MGPVDSMKKTTSAKPAGKKTGSPQKSAKPSAASAEAPVVNGKHAGPAPSADLMSVYFSAKPKPANGTILETLPMVEKSAVHVLAEEYKSFLSKAVCASWTVKAIIERAEKMGFKPFPTDGRILKAGEKFYFNNDGTAVAMAVIGEKDPVKTGFNLIGAHVDSPQLELKPSTLIENKGVVQLKTKTRGGGTWISWFNRPLGIAGRVFEPLLDEKGQPKLDPDTHLPLQQTRYVRFDSPSLVIPLEPIHFNRQLNKGKEIMPEEDLAPLAGISRGTLETVTAHVASLFQKNGIDLGNAHRAELFLFPTTPPSDVGVDGSMILGQGHDDRAMCYAAMEGMIEATRASKVPAKTSVAFFFANEETGSMDRGGATSRWPESVTAQIIDSHSKLRPKNLTQARETALSKSFIFSADVAHGWYPPQAKYHDSQNAVYMGQGPALKADSSGHYATTPKGMAMAEDLFKRAGIPFQVMSTNQNVSCGTTIGPMIAANTNALTVDIGIPVLSMHSANEVASKVDLYLATKAFASFIRND
jgi:aspartyl aminopeptidase